MSELAPLHPRNNTFPGQVLVHIAADAPDWCGASRADPLPPEGLHERFLPETTFHDQQSTELQHAVLATAALQGGTEPDLLDEVAWWQTDDIWQYAPFAAVAYIRAAASRAGVPVRQACQDLAHRPRHYNDHSARVWSAIPTCGTDAIFFGSARGYQCAGRPLSNPGLS